MARSSDSFNKKEREKKRRKRKQDKAEKKAARKEAGVKEPEFMYQDEFGNLTTEPPDPNRKKKEIKLEDIAISTPLDRDDDDAGDGSKSGTVKFFNDEKGYGFINEKDSPKSFFVHINDLIDPIKDGDRVSFTTANGPKGPIAQNVKVLV